MPDSRPPPRPSLRFAALCTLAGLMVLLPLGEVLRYQTDEIQTLKAERALLDPLAHAVGLQRSLVSHADVAVLVLSGRRPLEHERRLRQSEVDAALHELKGTLSAGLWDRALAEADDLTHDWHLLAGRIQSGKVDLRGCQDGHRLLVEQTLQVMDLVVARAGADRAWAGLGPVNLRSLAAGQALVDASQRRAALEQAHAVLTVRSLQLHARLGRVHAARTHQIAGLAALVMVLGATLLGLWRRQQRTVEPPDGDGDPGQRRGHGRRTTDAPPRSADARALIEQWRQAEPDLASPSQPTLPPRP